MASKPAFQFTATLDQDIFLIQGLILTDSSGDVRNINDGTVLDQDGDPLRFPRGITSVAKTAVGLYKVVLDDQWVKLVGFAATPISAFQAIVLGTVDLNTLTLSALNTLTLIIDDDASAAFTTTFTTPTSVADILVQILAAQTSASNTTSTITLVTGPAGQKYLRIVSNTIGATSTQAISGTGRATLGLATTGTGLLMPRIGILDQNVKGKIVGSLAAQTINLVVTKPDGTGTNVVSGGFYLNLKLKNSTT